MKIAQLDAMKKGWFVGDFAPTCLRTGACEVACKRYNRGDVESRHLHKVAVELTVIVSGVARINGVVVRAGDIVCLEAGEPAEFEVVEDAITVVVKVPSVSGDKYPA